MTTPNSDPVGDTAAPATKSKSEATASPKQRKKVRVKTRKRKSKSRVWKTRWVRAGKPQKSESK